MKNNEKVLEQFHYFNIKSEVDSIFGNWAVSREGDVVNYLYPYAIISVHLYEKDWVSYLRAKVWFRTTCEEDLRKAIERALEITNVK